MPAGFQKFYFSNDARALQKSFLDDVASQSTQNLRPIHVLVPNYYVAAHLRHLLAQQKAQLNLRFVTIRDLAKQTLSSNEAFLTKIRMTPEMELFQIGSIAKKVLRGTEQELISNKRGFHQNLRNLFHHLIGQGATKIPSINPKTKAFDQIFQQYLGLKTTFYNDPWLVEAAGGHTPSVPTVSHLYIFGMTKFTPLEMRWLQTLSKTSEINLWMERGFFEDLQEAVFTWAGETFDEAQEILGDIAGSPEGKRLVSPDKNFLVQPCAHLQDEATWIAQTILGFFGGQNSEVHGSERNHESEGCPPIKNPGQNGLHRIGIFLNDFRKQKIYIEHTLGQYKIPYVVYGGQPLTSTRIGQALEQLTELLFQNWKRDTWIRFLQTFPFKPEIYAMSGIPDMWNQWTIDAKITDKNTFFIPRLENFVRTHDVQLKAMRADGLAKHYIEWQKNLVSSLDAVEKTLNKSPAIFFQKLFEWIQTFADSTQIQDEHAIFFDDLIYMSRHSLGESEWTEIKPIVVEKLGQPAVQDKVFESDGVFIAPISLLPGLSFDTIFMPHLNEGCFPRSNPQSFDVTSQEMFKITQSTGVSFPSAENDFEIQRVLFETTQTRTSNLLISYAQFSLPGQEELRPSVFLHKLPVEKIFTNTMELPSTVSIDPAFTKSIQNYNEAFQAQTWSKYNALISNPAEKRTYSAHDLKTYLSCPRQYYLSQVLRLSVEDYPEDQFQVNPLDRGNLMHEILFKTFSRLKSENLFPLDPKNEEKIVAVAKSVANECFDRFVVGHAYGSEELWKIDRDELLDDVTKYMKHEIKEGKFWIPYALEYRFGMGARGEDEDERSNERPVSLPVLNKELSFRGKVDRIDLSPDKKQMRIIDYKTGAFKHVNWNYEKGTNLQIPLYMLLSKHFFPDIQPQRVEGSLVHVKSFSKFDRRTLLHESLSAAEEKILELLDVADTGINQGKFYPNPGFGRSNCRMCDFQAFCGENIDRDIESIPVDEFMDTYKQRKESIK
jgi:hypothetical protein